MKMSKNSEKVNLSKGPTSGIYIWSCPSCNGTFSWSEKINSMWGHPLDKAFCAVCFKYYDVENLPERSHIHEKV